MDKRNIIYLFLKNGVMLSPEEAEAIDETNYMQLLEKKLSENKGGAAVVSEPKRGRISCEEYIKTCGKNFEFLRDVLLRKTDAVSINKGKKIFSRVTIIGRARETRGNGFVVEDVTGETEVVGENNDVKAMDILGLRGSFKENRFHPEQVIWPDIPLENNPPPLSMKITLATKIKDDMNGVIIIPGREKSENIISGFGRIGVIRIKKYGRETVVLAYSPENQINEDESVKILKKRTISAEGMVNNVIKEIPNIFWLFNNARNWTSNYRGVVVVSTDKESFAECEKDEVVFGSL
jgi:uncharacterized protein YrzB (UPF0473 family)